MKGELETFNRIEPTWRVAGEWVVREDTSITKIDVPGFVVWAGDAFQSLTVKGVGNELTPQMVNWLKTEMGDDSKRDFTRVHPAFSRVFPIPSLPPTVYPEWRPWTEIPTFDPSRVVVVQPLILTPVAVPKVMVSNEVQAASYTPPRTDPFLMAEADKMGHVFDLTRGEAAGMRAVIISFWNNIAKAAERSHQADLAVKVSSSKKSAEAARIVMDEASSSMLDLAQRIAVYAKSLDTNGRRYPISMTARGVIQLPWLLKAAEAWMSPIKTLAIAGRLEIPGI